MKNINFTDWQDLWLKKDIQGISKKIDQFPMFNQVVIIEITIGILTLALGIISNINTDSAFIRKEILILIIIILVCASIIIPILVYSIDFYKKRKKTMSDIKNETMPVKEYVDTFDNEICNCVMMANTLCENISIEDKIEAQYFISETSYYLNKSIDKLWDMQSMANQIFNDNKKGSIKKVAPHRLLLVLILIIETRKEIDKILENEPDEKIYTHISNENNDYDEKLQRFIRHAHNNVSTDMGFDSLKIWPK
jgi:type II secretory pathway pseudopilin PulG